MGILDGSSRTLGGLLIISPTSLLVVSSKSAHLALRWHGSLDLDDVRQVRLRNYPIIEGTDILKGTDAAVQVIQNSVHFAESF